MNFWWDGCNKWLYIGTKQGQANQFVILLDDWLGWFQSNRLTIRNWTLFQITWDNGTWWGYAVDNALILNGKKYTCLDCFIQVTILGVGFRVQYSRKIIFDEEGFKNYLAQIGENAE